MGLPSDPIGVVFQCRCAVYTVDENNVMASYLRSLEAVRDQRGNPATHILRSSANFV